MSKPLVLQLVPHFGMGGAERMAVHLMSNLNQELFDVVAVSLYGRQNTDLEQMLEEQDKKVFYLDKRSGMDTRMYKALGDLFKSLEPQIVHSHLRVLRYSLPLYLRYRIPATIHTVHNLASKEVNRLGQAVHHVAFRSGVLPVAIALEVQESIKQLYKLKEENIPIVPNGIPIKRYEHCSKRRKMWREENQFRQNDFLYICIASMSQAKNQKLLIEAFLSCSDPVNDHLLLVGDGPLRNDLEKQAKARASHIHFLGQRRDIPDILSAADVFVLPSLYEGNPLSIMEAMSAAKTVIASAVGGVPELIDNEESGLLFPANDFEALIKAMQKVRSNTNLRQSLGANAYEKASK